MGVLDDAIRDHLELKRAHGTDPVEVSRLEREVFGGGAPPEGIADDQLADALAPIEASGGAFIDDVSPAGLELNQLPEPTFLDETQPLDSVVALGDTQLHASPEGEATSLHTSAEAASVQLPPARFKDLDDEDFDIAKSVPAVSAEAPAVTKVPASEEAAAVHQVEIAAPVVSEPPVSEPTPIIEPAPSLAEEPVPSFKPRSGGLFSAGERSIFSRGRTTDQTSPEPSADGGFGSHAPATPVTGPDSGLAPRQAPGTTDPSDVLSETPDFLEETPEHDRLWFEQKPPRDFDF